MKKVTLALLGAGQRGSEAYGAYALSYPNEVSYVAVAEPDKERRELFKKLHNISDDMCFESWEQLLAKPKLADAIVICMQDSMHFQPAIQSLEKGYHILLEKPMSNDPNECLIMGEYAEKYKRVFAICHVLRYTDFFATLKKLLTEGKIGKLVSVQHNENVAYWHQAHSFVRGNWNNSDETSPMILAKCCHDMDAMLWLVGADCTSISSFGSLTHFKKENAPAGAPLRCLDGCPAEDECAFYAPRTYLTGNVEWPTAAISNDMSLESRIKALKEGPYGRCVYHCNNNVVDHQVVSIQFANDVTAAFTMCAFTNQCNRTIKLMGTKGEIRGAMEKSEIEITDFLTGSKETIQLNNSNIGHGGGDFGIMRDFIRQVQSDGKIEGRTSAKNSVQSHLMSFAAEKSRLENKVININEYIKELKGKQ